MSVANMLTRALTATSLCCLMTACGGSDGAVDEPPTLPPVSEQSQGQLSSAGAQTLFTSNISVSVEVTDGNGLRSVYLTIANSAQTLSICSSCGDRFSASVDGINPADYGAQPGNVALSLWVTDGLGNTTEVAQLSIEWQPPVIAGLMATRSSAGDAIDVNWELHPQLLRYNLYLAAQPGVSRFTYTELAEGQALLAVEQNSQQFSGLDPATTYYLLVRGVDGSGESTSNPEMVLPGSTSPPVNSAPVATADEATTDEDVAVTILPLINDTDADGDTLSITDATTDIGSVSVTQDSITFTPPADVNGTATINYSISDGNGGSASSQINVTIVAVNDPPQAVDDEASTPSTQSVNIDVLSNDIDVDGDALSVLDASAASGQVSIESDGTITYTPESTFSGIDSFDYIVSDGVAQDTGTVTVTVTSAGRAPIAVGDRYDIGESTNLDIGVEQGLLANDVSVDSNAISVVTTPVLAPSHGILTLQPDGSFLYEPDSGFKGSDLFDYQINDENGLSATARVNISIESIPQMLFAESLSISGELLYIGLGETAPGNRIGTGRYSIGDCTRLGETVCSMVGRYQESASSGNSPGAAGSYAFVQRWSGTGDSPVIAQSRTPEDSSLVFTEVGDALFELRLYPDSGNVIEAVFPDQPFENSLNFNAFIGQNEFCTGLPAGVTCNIGQVGLYPDAILMAPLQNLFMDIPGSKYGLSDKSRPVANDDQISVQTDQSYSASGDEILANDSDADTGTVGDRLEATSIIQPSSVTDFVAVGFDQYRQRLFTYSEFSEMLYEFTLDGEIVNTITLPELAGDNADIHIAPEAFTLVDTTVPQGTILLFNGESNTVVVSAFESQSGRLLARLDTNFGSSEVVGGVYNSVTDTLFVIQSGLASDMPNTVAQIDPRTGDTLSTFSIANRFSMVRGDMGYNNRTGHLYFVSSDQRRLAEFSSNSQFVRYIDFPVGTDFSAAGLAISNDNDDIWLATVDAQLIRMQFANRGRLPQWRTELYVSPDHGSATLRYDGSFSYIPEAGYSGQDRFIYRIINAAGRDSVATVMVTVQP
ncbi:Ig-like domain-containing protein [Aestuariibacter salexigens]|uniref:Ig-like domain-containing protein n=1 Tax=Aestuariibacter salexigens TaxID=226010 RepID=UPI0004144CE3|nr:Ig-like domain-containing protein [Aestuariibacter salexigens]